MAVLQNKIDFALVFSVKNANPNGDPLNGNIPRMTYNNYEKGRCEPSIETLVKLADHYHVTLDYLVGREFANDAGYLTADEKEMLKMFRKLDTIKKAKAVAYTAGMLTLA